MKRTTATPREMIEELIAGPYRGRGGAAALALELKISSTAMRNYRQGREPAYAQRLEIERMYRAHGLHETPPAPPATNEGSE